MIVAVIDTETTGRDPDEVIELAALVNKTAPKVYVPFGFVNAADGRIAIGSGFDHVLKRFKPLERSTYKAMSIHGILPETLVDCQPASDAPAYAADFEAVIAHNAPFDVGVLGIEPPLVIDTLALSRAFCPDDDGHTLGAMMFRIDYRTGFDHMKVAHQADADVNACAVLLDWLVDEFVAPTSRTWASLAYLSEALAAPETIQFGKHRGTRWDDLPGDYIRWYLNLPINDQDPAVRSRMQDVQAYRIGSKVRCPHCDGLGAIKDDETNLWSLCSCFQSKR